MAGPDGGAAIDLIAQPDLSAPPTGKAIWEKALGGQGTELGNAVAVDKAGNVILAGEFTSSIALGHPPLDSVGDYDILLARFAPDGNPLWSRRLGGALYDSARQVAVIPSGILLAGVFSGTTDLGGRRHTSLGDRDIFLARFGESSGSHQWSVRMGGGGADVVTGLAADPGEKILITGSFTNTAYFGPEPLVSAGDEDIFMAKLDASGSPLWSRRFGGAAQDQAAAIAIDAGGNILLAGSFEGTIDLGGGPLHSAGGTVDAFVAKLDTDGKFLWSRTIGSERETDRATAVAVGLAGEVIVAGKFAGEAQVSGGERLYGDGGDDGFVAIYAAGGELRRAWRIGGQGNDQPRALAVDPAGNLLLAGSFEGTASLGWEQPRSNGGTDLFVAKFNRLGQPVWSKGFGGTAADVALGLAVDAAGHVLCAGHFQRVIDLDQGPLRAVAGDDLLLFKRAP